MISLYQDPKGENVFSDNTKTETGGVQGIKQETDVNLTGYRNNAEKSLDPDESVSVLRARVSYLEKRLAEVMDMVAIYSGQ